MNNRGLIILIVIFIGLFVAVFLQNRQIEQSAQATPEPPMARVFPDLAVLDIQAIQIRDIRTEETFTIARDTNGQWIAPSIDGELRERAGTGIAQTIVLLPFTRTIEITDEINLADFGFDPFGYLLIQVLLSNGEEHVISIGNPLQQEPEFYILVDDTPVLYTAFRQPYDYLASLLDDPPIVEN